MSSNPLGQIACFSVCWCPACRKRETVPQIWHCLLLPNKWQQLLWPSIYLRGSGAELLGSIPVGLRVGGPERCCLCLKTPINIWLIHGIQGLWLLVGNYFLPASQSEKWAVLVWSLPVICLTRTDVCSSPLPICWYQNGTVHCLLHKLMLHVCLTTDRMTVPVKGSMWHMR